MNAHVFHLEWVGKSYILFLSIDHQSKCNITLYTLKDSASRPFCIKLRGPSGMKISAIKLNNSGARAATSSLLHALKCSFNSSLKWNPIEVTRCTCVINHALIKYKVISSKPLA